MVIEAFPGVKMLGKTISHLLRNRLKERLRDYAGSRPFGRKNLRRHKVCGYRIEEKI